MQRTPVRIGVTCDFETITDRRGAPSPRYLLQASYVRAVAHTGALPVLLPHLDPELAPAVLEGLDGVVFSGGDFDIPPSYYGQEPRPKLGHLLEERSAYERALCAEALARDVPVLGVCGGMQLLNVVCGGTLHQDLSERPGTGVHQQPHDKRQPHHGVEITSASLLARAVGATRLEVNSTHHQLVHALGRRVRATAVAPDGVVEGIEVEGKRFAMGVQWHPEALATPEQLAIYEALVEAARFARDASSVSSSST